MSTNYERNKEIEKFLELVHSYLGKTRTLIAEAAPNSISSKLVEKSHFLSGMTREISENMRAKERPG